MTTVSPAQKKPLQDFVKAFTDKQVYNDFALVSRNFYEVPEELKKVTDQIRHPFYSAGECLGHLAGHRFVPSIVLLKRLAPLTNRRVTVSDEAAWLFCCGRDILPKAVIGSCPGDGLVLVQNRRSEILCYGEASAGVITVKNRLDIGNFLRRER